MTNEEKELFKALRTQFTAVVDVLEANGDVDTCAVLSCSLINMGNQILSSNTIVVNKN